MAVCGRKKAGVMSARAKIELNACNRQKLDDTGRVQVFTHYAGSLMPVRDVRRETEPHIEASASNYVKRCAHGDYRSFCHSPSRYLFLATSCLNRAAGQGGFRGKRFIVGYIRRILCIASQDRWSVFGKVHIVPFHPALEYSKLGFGIRKQRLDEAESRRLLRLLNARSNLRDKCVREMLRIEEREHAQGHAVIADHACMDKKGECVLEDKCLRKRFARTKR